MTPSLSQLSVTASETLFRSAAADDLHLILLGGSSWRVLFVCDYGLTIQPDDTMHLSKAWMG